MNLTHYHSKFLQKIWRDTRDEKKKQIDRLLMPMCHPAKQVIYKPLSVDSKNSWLFRTQQDLYEVVFVFVDETISNLHVPHFRLNLKTRCRKFGRQMAGVFRAIEVDQRMCWELLGCNVFENFSIRSDATRIFLWQLFLEQLSGMVFEAFCWSVAKDFTSRPLATIYEIDAKRCFGRHSKLEHKTSILSKIWKKFVRSHILENYSLLPIFTLYFRVESPAPTKKIDRTPQVQAWEQRHSSLGLKGPANIVPKNAETYRVLYRYNPQHPDELELIENDIVFVVEKCDDGWYIGRRNPITETHNF